MAENKIEKKTTPRASLMRLEKWVNRAKENIGFARSNISEVANHVLIFKKTLERETRRLNKKLIKIIATRIREKAKTSYKTANKELNSEFNKTLSIGREQGFSKAFEIMKSTIQHKFPELMETIKKVEESTEY